MFNAELRKALLSTPLCHYLNYDELDLLTTQSKFISFEPGEIITTQGEKSEGIYIILEGSASVTARILGEGVAHLTTLKHGNFIGAVSLIEDGLRATSIVAKTKVICMLITKNYFDTLALFFPETKYKFTLAIAEDVYSRIQYTYQKITDIMSTSHMTTRSIFSEVIKSFNKPELIKSEDVHFDLNQLKTAAFFENFTDEEIKYFVEQGELIMASAGCHLIHEGEQNTPNYFILSGAVQANITKDNKVAKVGVLGPLTFFCSLTTLDNNASAIINYTTCERVLLLKISHEKYELLKNENLRLWYKVFDGVCKSYVVLERSIEKLAIRLDIELYNR